MSTQEKYIRRTSQNGKIDKIDDGDFFVHLKIRIHHFYIIYLHKIMTIENDRHLRMAIALYPRLDFWLIELCIIDVLSAVFITLTILFFFLPDWIIQRLPCVCCAMCVKEITSLLDLHYSNTVDKIFCLLIRFRLSFFCKVMHWIFNDDRRLVRRVVYACRDLSVVRTGNSPVNELPFSMLLWILYNIHHLSKASFNFNHAVYLSSITSVVILQLV